MKKQLIVLSVLLVVASSQCSMYDKMKASAKSAYSSMKSKLTSAKQSIQAKFPGMQQMVTENLPSVQEYAKTNIFPTAQKIAEDQVILGDKLDELTKGIPYGKEVVDKLRTAYMSTYHPNFEKRVDEDGSVQWVDSSNVK